MSARASSDSSLPDTGAGSLPCWTPAASRSSSLSRFKTCFCTLRSRWRARRLLGSQRAPPCAARRCSRHGARRARRWHGARVLLSCHIGLGLKKHFRNSRATPRSLPTLRGAPRAQCVAVRAAAKYDYDLVIVGCGVGGHGAALHAVESGLKVAVLDGNDVGGTCVNRGCVPSKALLAASGRIRDFRDEHHLKQLGITARQSPAARAALWRADLTCCAAGGQRHVRS